MTALLSSDVDTALQVVRNGGLVAIPTETVYGLAGDADNPFAVQRIFTAKGRPGDHPLIVHIADAEHIGQWAARVPPAAEVLIDACWPGPLTVLVPRASRVLDVVTGGRSTVGLRVPAHPLTEALLTRFGGGLAAPSANRFGHVSPTTPAHVLDDLGSVIDMVLDGGQCPVGVESTIVDCSVDPPQVLRPGGITTEQVHALLHGRVAAASGPSRAAGMLASHYSPHATVLLADTARQATELLHGHPGAALIDRTDDLVAYARHLYDDLRRADAEGTQVVVAVLPPAAGLGHAIRDRLAKAAHT